MNVTIKFLAIVVYLISVIICCTILAIAFNNWWLMLLSILFLHIDVNVKEEENDGEKEI